VGLADLPFRTESFGALDSSQDEMLRRLGRDEWVHGLVIRAGAQSGGRGRRRRPWLSPPGGSYQTLALRDPAPPSLRRGAIALALAIGLAETLRTYGVRCGVKWPNDLYYRGKKLAGLLSEYRREHLLVGVGVNVDNPVPEGAVGLRGWDLAAVHPVVLEGLRQGLRLLETEKELLSRFEPLDLLRDQPVTAVLEGERFGATARGITAEGCLKLERADGRISELCGGGLEGFTLR
jgi:BirA family biotin operon repressor/biotin-[acetyl-CoA-carboxylase] ligase